MAVPRKAWRFGVCLASERRSTRSCTHPGSGCRWLQAARGANPRGRYGRGNWISAAADGLRARHVGARSRLDLAQCTTWACASREADLLQQRPAAHSDDLRAPLRDALRLRARPGGQQRRARRGLRDASRHPGFAGADLFFLGAAGRGVDGAWIADGGVAGYVPVRCAKQRVSTLVHSGAITGDSFRLVLDTSAPRCVRAAYALRTRCRPARCRPRPRCRGTARRSTSSRRLRASPTCARSTWRAPTSAVGRRSST